jgi:predicted Zn-dependent protease
LGLSYFKTQDYSKAVELLQDVLSSGSTNVELWYALASSLIKVGKIHDAEHTIEEMTILTGTTPRLSQVRYELEEAKRENETSKKLKKQKPQ